MLPIAFIDDHCQLRGYISAILEKDPFNYQVFQYENGLDFITRLPIQNYIPTIVLMDIRMSPMNGYETTEWLHNNHPDIPILAFSDVHEVGAILKISRCGASGCISKNFQDNDVFKAAIEMVINGEKYYEDIEMHKFINKYILYDSKDINEGLCSLTKRQIEIVMMVDQNNTNAENADKLCISTFTYKKHLRNIFQKFGIKNISALRNIAYALGLINNL